MTDLCTPMRVLDGLEEESYAQEGELGEALREVIVTILTGQDPAMVDMLHHLYACATANALVRASVDHQLNLMRIFHEISEDTYKRATEWSAAQLPSE